MYFIELGIDATYYLDTTSEKAAVPFSCHAAFAEDIDDLESSSVVAQNDIDRLNHRLGEMCPYWAPFIRLIRMNSARALNIIW
jgi:hypothetical protein